MPSTAGPFIYLQTQKWNPISMLIRFETRSRWSHAGFVLGDSYLSAQGDGVKIRPRDKSCELLLLTAPGIESAYQWALGEVGKPYDYSALFGLALDRDWQENDSWFCSELVAAAFEAVDAPLFNPKFQLNRITPSHIPSSLVVELVEG